MFSSPSPTEAGIDGLAITRQWLGEAFERLQAGGDGSTLPSPSSANPPPPQANTPATAFPPTPNNILREAYLSLLTWDAEQEFPEVRPHPSTTLSYVQFLLTLLILSPANGKTLSSYGPVELCRDTRAKAGRVD